MRRPLSILLPLVICGLFIVVLGPILFSNREPSFKGRTLTHWLTMDYLAGSPEQEQEPIDAVRRIGTNALPFLLKWISCQSSPWQDKIDAAIGKLPVWLRDST